MSSTDDKIRYEILEILCAQKPETIFDSGEISRKRLLRALSFKPEQIDKNVSNLEARGLVKVYSTIFDDTPWSTVSITTRGIEYFESINIEDYSPASNVSHQSVHVEGNVYGSIGQTLKGDVINISQISESFNEVRSLIRSNDLMSSYAKEEAIKHIDILEKEAKKENPNKDIIQRSWDWLKQNTPRFVESILTKIIAGLILRAI